MKEKLFISSATKNNWDKLNLSEEEKLSKLSKRANKQNSQKNIIPVEYFKNKRNIKLVTNILDYVNKKNLPIEDVIYNLAMNILSKNEFVEIVLNRVYTGNLYITEIIEEYGVYYLDETLLKYNLPFDEPDILGIIYQSLLKEGKKNAKGSYYTPRNIVEKIVQKSKPTDTILDPCCGTGSFLLEFANKISNPKNIYGADIDPIACFIAKVNLIIKFKTIHFRPNIFNIDFLKDNSKLKNIEFNIIATNPPWGAKNKKEYTNLYPNITSKESYSYFIVKSESILKKNGKCYFILPESILNVSAHQDIRKFILENFAIKEIELLDKAFSGVLTNVVKIELTKEHNENIKITQKNSTKIINQNTYETNIHNNFSILDEIDIKIIEKIYSKKYDTLKNSKWGLGIVTGNNSKHINTDPNNEKIYTGKEIKPYIIEESQKHIKFDRTKFQQVAPEEIYRADEKLIYKFISKRLVFAYDNQKRLVLNSANILIPNVKTHSIKTVLAFLNSRLFQYLYTKIFNELKILRGNLEELPFPELTKTQIKEIESLVDNYLSSNNLDYINEIDKLIFRIFDLTEEEISLI